MSTLLDPPRWSEEELARATSRAAEDFRVTRVREPLERYVAVLDDRRLAFDDLFVALSDLVAPSSLDDETIATILASPRLFEAFRYLAGPPISEDDLEVVADVPSLAPRELRRDPSRARRVFDVVLHGLDRRRFPWVAEGRSPTVEERREALLASASLLAAQRTATERRSEGKRAQEEMVCRALETIGFRRVAARSIETLDTAPAPGEYCPESMLGGRKADVVVRLHDRRTLAVECKVSNSALNSIKRVKNDAAAKAVAWHRELGTRQVVPAAMLSGVFDVHTLVEAQAQGLTLFWAHDLASFQSWVGSATRSS